MSARGIRVLLGVILGLSVALSIAFALRLPLNRNPDEVDHRDYVRLILQNHGFVRFHETPFEQKSTPETPRPFETHQPPLYYLLCVPVQAASGGNVFAVRMVAALLQILTILVAFRCVRDIFPDRPELFLGAAAFVAFLPVQAQLSGAITNDALTTLICATLFWKLSRLVRKGQNLQHAAMVGALIGLGLLTKLSVLQLLPAVAAAYILAVLGKKLTPSTAVIRFVQAVAIGLVIGSPWLIRNTLLYGDPLAAHIYRLTGPNLTPHQIMQISGWSMGDYVRNVGVRSFATFWYFVDPNLPLDERFVGPRAPLTVVLVLALGALFGVYRYFKAEGESADQRRAVALALLTIGLLVPFYTVFVLTIFQAQGRYFLPVLLPIALVSVLGWSQLTRQRQPWWGVMALMGALFVLSALQLFLSGDIASILK